MKRSFVLGWHGVCSAVLVAGAAWRGAADGAPDLSTAAAQTLRREWLAAREKTESERVAAQAELLAKQTQTAREQLARARVTGNVTQQAVARTALQIFEKAGERLKKDGVFELPADARREVQPLLDTARRSAEGIEAVRKSALAALASETAHKLRAALAEQGTPVDSDAAAEALLQQLEVVEAKVAELAPAPDAAVPGTAPSGAASVADTAAPKDPEEIGSNGGATDWEPLLTVGVRVAVLEVVAVPVLGIEAERAYTEAAMGSEGEIAVRIVPHQSLLRSEGTVLFRAMSLPGKGKPDVMTWPSARNDWKLEMRCRPQGEAPVALRLDVSRASAQLKAVAGAEAVAASASVRDEAKVVVKIVTRPEGAGVWVDGRAQMQGQQPMLTPCEVAIPASGAAVVLRKRGHLDGQLGKVVPKEGQVLQAALTPDPEYVDRTLRVQALVAGGHSGVTLKAGQRVRLTVDGQWACGSRGELVGPEGYAIAAFPHYYVNPALTPRVVVEAPYGALLVRVGATGAWHAVGRESSLKAEASGPLMFDINEAPERNLRRDNKGALQVHVRTVP